LRFYYPYNPHISRSCQRIRKALIDYRPEGIEFTDTPDGDDIHILDYIGQHPSIEDRELNPKTGLMRTVPSLPRTRNYILLYHTWNHEYTPLKETAKLFYKALLVITHSPFLAKPDVRFNALRADFDGIDFFVTPWGYDEKVFYPEVRERHFLIITTGYVAREEWIDKV